MDDTRAQTPCSGARRVTPHGVAPLVCAGGHIGGGSPRDAGGRRRIDLVGSWGDTLLGHARHEVIAAAEALATP